MFLPSLHTGRLQAIQFWGGLMGKKSLFAQIYQWLLEDMLFTSVPSSTLICLSLWPLEGILSCYGALKGPALALNIASGTKNMGTPFHLPDLPTLHPTTVPFPLPLLKGEKAVNIILQKQTGLFLLHPIVTQSVKLNEHFLMAVQKCVFVAGTHIICYKCIFHLWYYMINQINEIKLPSITFTGSNSLNSTQGDKTRGYRISSCSS